MAETGSDDRQTSKPYFVVSSKPYSVGQEIRFTAMNVPASNISFWIVKHNGIIKKIEDNTSTFTHVPRQEGKYGIAVVYFASPQDRAMHSLTRWITVGNTPPENRKTNGPIASQRNRFNLVREANTPIVTIASSEWREQKSGYGKWTTPSEFERISTVGNALLKTGKQSDGYNTGWLLFVPRGRNELQFRVYHYDFANHRGVYRYGGTLDLHGKTIDPQSISFIEVHSRAAIVQWKAADGSLGRVRISKYRSRGNSYATSGIREILFLDSGKKGGKQAQKKNVTPWKNIAPGVDQRFDENWRCELKIAPDTRYIFVEMKALGYGGTVCMVDPTGVCLSSGSQQAFTMKLEPGTHFLPLVDGRIAKQKKIIGYRYFFWSSDKRLIGMATGRTGQENPALTLDRANTKPAADIRLLKYGTNMWALRFQNGKLQIGGDQTHKNYAWTPRHWITVGREVNTFRGYGTGAGPLLIFRERGRWSAVILDYATGERRKRISTSNPISLEKAGRYGAVMKIGNRCYDFSTNHLNNIPEVDCSSYRYTGGELN